MIKRGWVPVVRALCTFVICSLTCGAYAAETAGAGGEGTTRSAPSAVTADFSKPLACYRALKVPVIRGIIMVEGNRAVFGGSLGSRKGIFTIGPRYGTFDTPPPVNEKRPPTYHFDLDAKGDEIYFYTEDDGRASGARSVPKNNQEPRDPKGSPTTRIGEQPGRIPTVDATEAIDRELATLLRTAPQALRESRQHARSMNLPKDYDPALPLKEALCICLKAGLPMVTAEVKQVLLKTGLEQKDVDECADDRVSALSIPGQRYSRAATWPGPG